MTQEIAAAKRISRKDVAFVGALIGTFVFALFFQYVWVNADLAQAANAALFAVLGIYFLQRAYTDRSKQGGIYGAVLVVAGLAWLTFATMIALGLASGF